MEPQQNQNPVQNQAPAPTPTPNPQQVQASVEKSSVGSIIGIVVIVILLIVGGLYFWGDSLFHGDHEETATTTADGSELESIQKDLSAQGNLDADFSDIDSALNE